MRKYLISFLLLCVLALAFLPVPLFSNMDGVYNTWSGLIWCNNEDACYHEIGHKLDIDGCMASRSEYFRIMVNHQEKILSDLHIGPNVHAEFPQYIMLLGFESDPYAETYAAIFALSKGKKENVLPGFRDFYDWEQAQKIIVEFDFPPI